MLVIKPIGGLCNRMRAIDSAVALGRKVDRPVRVIWERNTDLNCRYDHLFNPSPHFTVKETGYFSNRHPHTFASRLLLKTQTYKLFSAGRYRKVLYDEDLENKDIYPVCEALLKSPGTVLIICCCKFLPTGSLQEHFNPIPLIEEKIKWQADQISPQTIGIHMRRTDNVKAIKHSPDELFIQAMEMEIGNDADANFFVATDSEQTLNQLHAIFPGKIISHPNERTRNSEKGVQDALIDLICLSRTKKIYGSFWSSFSEVAAELSGIEMITATQSLETLHLSSDNRK